MTYRQIHTEIWDDDWTIELEPLEKLLWIYLFSNSRTHYIGLYQLPRKKAAFETGIPAQTITEILNRFEQDGKIKVNSSWIWVKNMLVRNVNNLRSPQIQAGIEKAFREIPNSCPFKADWAKYYNTIISPQYGIDTISIPHPYPDSAADTFCSATASVPASVPDSVTDPDLESEAVDAFIKVRGGAVNQLMMEQLADLVTEASEHLQTLPRASPGADLSGDTWVKEAIAVANGATDTGLVSINFITSIIRRWFAEGYKSPLKGKRNGNDSEATISIQGHRPRAATPEEFYGPDG